MLSSLLCVASTVPGGAQRYAFKTYGQAQGLKNLNVDSLLQDRDGLMWMGTDNGLFRYDGSRFQQFSTAEGLTNPYVIALAQDPTGRLWVGTGGGLFYREDGRFKEVLYKGRPIGVGVDTSMAALDDGRLLVVGNYRLFVISRRADGSAYAQPALELREFRGLVSDDTITSVLAQGSEEIWLGCGKGLCQFHDGQLHRWGAGEGVPDALWYALFVSRDGSLWARSNNRVIALPRGARRFEDRTGGDAGRFTNNYYISFAETSDGKIATAGKTGLALWKEGRWSFLNEAQGLSASPLSSLLVDHRGRIWMGLVGHGVERWLGYGKWENWTAAEGLGNPIVWGILSDEKNRLWIAEESGVSLSDSSRTHFRSVTGSLKDFARSMQGITQDRNGNIWAVSGQGVLIKINSAKLKIERYPDVPSGHQIYADAHNRIWISTEQGLYVLDDAATARKAVKVDLAGAQATDVYRVVEDREGDLWAASLGGLFEMVNGVWKVVPIEVPSLPTQFVDIGFAADGSLWAVTDYSRVWRITVKDGQVVAAQKMGPQQVSSDAAVFVRSDRRGRVWVGNDQGVDVFDGQSWRLFNTDDGLLWNDVNAKAFFADRDGSVWIGTSEGLSHYSGLSVAAAAPPPAPRIDSILYGLKPLRAGRFKTFWGGKPLDIVFSPVAYEHEEELTYRYRLSDVDPDWIATDQNAAHYSPLPPGAYTFELISVDPVSRLVSPATMVHFVIAPRWWQTWIASVAEVLVVIACVLFAWRLRIRHLLGRQRELETLVSVRTRELEQLATRDALTGLLNRNRIVELLTSEFARATRTNTVLAVVLIDIDYFKSINDEHGHLAGDAVLREIGQRFSNGIRTYDAAGRYGGEEFLVLLPYQQRLSDLEMVTFGTRLEELKEALTGEPILLREKSLMVTCSIGVALAGGDYAAVAEDALAAADRALYVAKKRGRNRIEYASSDPVPSRVSRGNSPGSSLS
jgi:diguanylate cyclase (GGDEF)-like protein